MTSRYNITAAVLSEIMDEREAQDDRWGVQDHPLHDVADPNGVSLLGRSYASLERICKERFRDHPPTGAVILLEEVFEALAARDPEDTREELVQVAAVAVMMIEALDRRPRVDFDKEGGRLRRAAQRASELIERKTVDLSGATYQPPIFTEEQKAAFLAGLKPSTFEITFGPDPFANMPDRLVLTVIEPAACSECLLPLNDHNPSGWGCATGGRRPVTVDEYGHRSDCPGCSAPTCGPPLCPGCGCEQHTGFCEACGCLDNREAPEPICDHCRLPGHSSGDCPDAGRPAAEARGDHDG